MLFITNRFPTQSIRSRKGRRFTFDLDNNAPSNSVFYCETGADGHHVEITSGELLKRVRESECRQILLYVHGFNNLPDVVFERAAALQAFCDKAKPKEVLVLPLIWPCDNDRGVVKDYWDDQKSADQSGYSFARVLERFMEWRNSADNEPDVAPCLKRINLLAHSMGNRVLRQTLVAWNRYDLADGVPLLLRNTFMVAADVVNETVHEGKAGELISHASRNVVVYYASDDLALRASKAANLRNKVASRRLGHTGPENIARAPRNLFQVDCDDVNTGYDRPTGHMYFLDDGGGKKPGKVFNHMFECILHGRVFPDDPDQRSIILK
ncbi:MULTISPECIES: alpha/beta hydrolase [unclassified Shimia]|uniref:alpha/beta hydrolase n=1 Tax=unclassified Shimia TaxID=2630038 RepID=UPI001ADB7556|nr:MULTISPECIES: alpha/beta hydrolase [unclassified Shimia]MBO9473969.1 alpha/beta hydrolase [Shimia sp. R10_1]MDA5557638.1 alpha/beta hydrolase [Shimia sp. MMG029]